MLHSLQPVRGPVNFISAQLYTVVNNFSRASQLKSYFGWAPLVAQSGHSLDRARLSPRGTRLMKRTMYLIVWKAVQTEGSEWAQMYQRLVPIKCSYNERTHRYTGRGRVIGRIAGQMISVIYALLKKDQAVLEKLPRGVKPPEPVLYDQKVHRQHRAGQYSAPAAPKPGKLIQLPPR